MNEILKIAFWGSVALILYTYFGYPVLVALVASQRRPSKHPGNPNANALPSVTVIIPAHNEERWIERKIENTLALDYPQERMRILIASDGSTDRTVEIAQRYATESVEVVDFPERTGKIATVDRSIRRASGEIVLITDATAMLDRDSLSLLVPHFQDPEVGCVAGDRVCVATGSSATEGEGLYLRYEAWIKRSESRLRSCLGGYGPILAVRRSLVPALPGATDDFYIPMKILASTGARTVFEPDAKARIPAAKTLRQEFKRKARTHAALLSDLPRLGQALNPWKGAIWWQFWSHRVLRLFVPWAMLVALLVSQWLWNAGVVYKLALLSQGLFYASALCGSLLVSLRGIRSQPFYACFYFVFANAAVGMGWFRWLKGEPASTWERTDRYLPGLPTG
jgi:cellulose synthase/poly-beta-1,6-N-acetylglucosamine synthase-like glycosyltransferase